MAHFDAERRMEAQQLQKRIDEIKTTIYSDRRPIGNCEFVVTGTGKGPERAPAKGWKPFDVSKQQRWGGYDQTTWFRFQATIPKAWKGMKAVALVRPSLTSFALGIEGLSAGAEAPFSSRPRRGISASSLRPSIAAWAGWSAAGSLSRSSNSLRVLKFRSKSK